MRRALLVVAVVAVVGIGTGVFVSIKTDRVLGGCRWRSVDEAEYVAGNRAILDGLPVYPGATRWNTYSIGQRASDACLPAESGPPFDRYSTVDSYTFPPDGRDIVSAPWKVWDKFGNTRVPAQVPSVLVWYDSALRESGWQRSGWSAHESYFKRGSDILAVGAQLNTDDPYKRDPYHQITILRGD